MIHIVFQEADIAVLEKSFELDENLRGEIILIRDDYAVGPLANIYEPEGIEARRNWWREVLTGSELEAAVDNGSVDDNRVVADLVEKLTAEPDENLWIWAAQNKHDVCGYYWLMSQLAPFSGRVFILYLNNLPFINEKGNIFYPVNLFEIQPKEFLKAKKLSRPISLSEFEIDPDEWKRLCDMGKMVRTLDAGKKLMSHDEDYYDEALLKFISSDWLKVHKLISNFLSKSAQTTGDAFLLWRIRVMISDGRLEGQGDASLRKEYEVKLPSREHIVIE